MTDPAIPRTTIFDLSSDALGRWLEGIGERDFRSKQIFEWVYRRLVDDYDAMRNVPAKVRRALADDFPFGRLGIAKTLTSGNGYTRKLLFSLPEGDGVEAVFMRDRDRVTYCISSQAGCPLACKFCATGHAGFTRNLTAGEIIEQVHVLARTIDPPQNIVYMGMGEPLLNVSAVMESLRRLTDHDKFALSPRRITVSTVGIVPAMERLATLKRAPNLAISLHAPNDELRESLMPINRQYPLADVLSAAKRYLRATDRVLTLEYIMIADCNIEDEHADQLAEMAKATAAKVNLLAFNPVVEAGLKTPDAAAECAFRDRLRSRGVNATIRFRRGRDIDAACGQLRGSLVAPRSGISS